ncbi:MAG: heparinase II/III family protein [Hyphomicrobiaceae bacterium]
MAIVRVDTQMPDLSIKDRMTVRRLLSEQTRQSVLARLLNSKLLRWRYGVVSSDKLLLVPSDLRSADASLVTEYRQGHFGLAGTPVELNELSPFDAVAPNETWRNALHGFDWLNHFTASQDPESPDMARGLVVDWIKRRHGKSDPCWQPDILGRRLASWLSHADLLLGDTDAKTYDLILRSIGEQFIRLAATWRSAPQGLPRLQSLTFLLLANLCIAGHDRKRPRIQRMFCEELSQQILEDGGHLDRNPTTAVTLLLDFLPLEKCFANRGLSEPDVLVQARQRMFGFLRFMRLGDGDLARFNGVGATEGASLARLLAYDDQEHSRLRGGVAQQSGYVRLTNQETVIVCDIGAAPGLEFAKSAQAGCLSFEMSIDKAPIFVNGGIPRSAHADWLPASRATASHNTLCLGETSSARLVQHSKLEGLIGGVAITEPSVVESKLSIRHGTQSFSANHNGYLQRFGILHFRELTLSSDGNILSGRDRLGPPEETGDLRLKQDVPFAVHFHLHPDVTVCAGEAPDQLEIEASDGVTLVFSCEGAIVSLEESMYFADSSSPRHATQIVLRGATFGESLVEWTLTRR